MSLNVKVAVRCRPFNKREKSMGASLIVDVSEDGRQVALTDKSAAANDAGARRAFTFDHVYFWGSTQEEVFEDLGLPIVEKALQGFNGTIFAYGQTGSGKTFSMMGDDTTPGIIPLMNADLFEKIAAMQAARPELQFLCLASYLEIYNEVIKDLLNPSDKQLNIREHPEMGVYVQDLAEIVVKNAADVSRLLTQGQKVRHVAATNMNDRSSRSHSCFTLKIEQRVVERIGDKEKTTTLTAKINLVDLAGSERADKTGATGDTLKQGAAINKSLSALGNVINALAEAKPGKGSSHIPYRDSKLTRLLQHSLGGNSLTVMVAAISPADDNFDESFSTLNYANRAKSIKNEAKKNEDVNEQMIRQLREEIEGLRKALAAAQQSGSGAAAAAPGEAEPLSDVQKAQMEELIANLERAKAQSWEEKEKLSQLFEKERSANLANENKVRAVMQTLKEDNLELLKRMRGLTNDKARLAKDYRAKKEANVATRAELAAGLAKYQEVFVADGQREDGPHRAELEKLLAAIEVINSRATAETAELTRIKEALRVVDASMLEERAVASAHRSLLEEDASLRKAIVEEERRKLEKDGALALEQQLAEERARLRESAARERAELLARYSESGASEREQKLELALIDAQEHSRLLMLEATQATQAHAAQLRSLQADHRREVHDIRVQELKVFREMVSGVEEDRAALEARITESRRLLSMAVKDVAFLQERCRELEKQVVLAAAYEPPGLS